MNAGKYLKFMVDRIRTSKPISQDAVRNLEIRNAFRPALRKMLVLPVEGEIIPRKGDQYYQLINIFLLTIRGKKLTKEGAVNITRLGFAEMLINTTIPTERQLAAVLSHYPDFKKFLLEEVEANKK
jgi:hypothetical protein